MEAVDTIMAEDTDTMESQYYSTVFVGGVPYYYCDGVYYDYQGGYIVPAPVMVVPSPMVIPPDQPVAQASTPAQPATKEVNQSVNPNSGNGSLSVGDAITINVPNAKGGFTPIKLVKYKDGFIGPQGELYSNHPTIAQLQVLYGN